MSETRHIDSNSALVATPAKTLKIAHVSATFPPYRGGTGNVCFYNARELARRGHAVTVFTSLQTGQPGQEDLAGFSLRRLKPLLSFGNARLLPELLAALTGFDLIHLHFPFFGGELTALAARRSHTPLVVTYHQDVLLQGPLGLVEKGLRYSAGRWTLRSAARLLFTSLDYGQASYVQTLLKGSSTPVGELANGVDTDFFQPGAAFDPTALCERLGLPVHKPVVLLVAGLDRSHYFKGVEIFLQALARLDGQVQGVIVGDGDLRPVYEQQAADSGVPVTFAGRVEQSDLPDFYRLASLTVLPSLTMGEAFGLVLLESLACGTPVIASNLPGVRTVVEPGSDGLLVEPGDVTGLANAINKLISDPVAARQMGERGRERIVRLYDWSEIGGRLEAIYYEILEQARR